MDAKSEEEAVAAAAALCFCASIKGVIGAAPSPMSRINSVAVRKASGDVSRAVTAAMQIVRKIFILILSAVPALDTQLSSLISHVSCLIL